MKQVYPILYRPYLIVLLLVSQLLNTQFAHAQIYSAPGIPRNMATGDRARITYMAYAPVAIPYYVSQGSFDSLDNFLNNWYNAGCSRQELIFSVGLLAAMEGRRTAGYPMPWDCLREFADYARLLKRIQRDGSDFTCTLQLENGKYDASDNIRKLITFEQQWALRLEHDIVLDTAEKFYCQIFAGEITDPKAAYKADPTLYPAIQNVRAAEHKYYDSVFDYKRKYRTSDYAITTGIWVPNGNLQLLGPKPYVGMLMGGRTRYNEFDFAWSYKMGSAHHDYYYTMHDTLYSTSHAEGGMVGFSYTRYLYRRKYFEFGVMTEPGMDYLFGGDTTDGGPQVSVGTFSFNNGLRCKYFFRRQGYLGCMIKYHMMNYGNRTVTNLDGNAWTLEFHYGSH